MTHIYKRMCWSSAALALLALTLAGPAPSRALADPLKEYLAIGDSVAFGANPLRDPQDADNFIGYPSPVAEAFEERLTNPSCPGETSSHFISLSGADLNCGLYRHSHPLHVSYATSQLDFADAFLASHPDTRLVSIDIGANDLFSLQAHCLGDITCILQGLPTMLATLSANLDTIYAHIRTHDRYRHKLVALTYYSLNYADRTTTYAISQVNQKVVERTLAWRGIVADAFGPFAAASALYNGDTCAAGLRIVLTKSPLTCDIHPSRAGRKLLARTILEALRPDDLDGWRGASASPAPAYQSQPPM